MTRRCWSSGGGGWCVRTGAPPARTAGRPKPLPATAHGRTARQTFHLKGLHASASGFRPRRPTTAVRVDSSALARCMCHTISHRCPAAAAQQRRLVHASGHATWGRAARGCQSRGVYMAVQLCTLLQPPSVVYLVATTLLNIAHAPQASLVGLFGNNVKRSHTSAFSALKQAHPPREPPPQSASSLSSEAPSAAQCAMMGNMRQRILHLASVKLATLTQVAGVNDPTKQCAALRNTTALLQHVLRHDIELLVGRHLDHVVLAALFCVCQVRTHVVCVYIFGLFAWSCCHAHHVRRSGSKPCPCKPCRSSTHAKQLPSAHPGRPHKTTGRGVRCLLGWR